MLSNSWGTALSLIGFCAGVVVIIQRLRLKCPRCGERFDEIQIPQSIRQALIGGYTCPACGCKCDERGRDVTHKVNNQHGGKTSQ
jgi:predicted RNA-binding Zn-ribbon protein involved in translation (DUF1610 family)